MPAKKVSAKGGSASGGKNVKPATTETTEKKHSDKTVVVRKTKPKSSGLSIPLFDVAGKKKGLVPVPEEIFGSKINPVLMAQAVRVYLANQRQGTASTKTRAEVKGSTRKIYRQKGTGRARHGAVTAPIFVGGGIAFGPKPRDFRLDLPKKMKRKALFSALASKFKEDKIIAVDLAKLNGKTKEIHSMFKALKLLDKKSKADKVLFVTDKNKETYYSSRNIEGAKSCAFATINTYDVLSSKHIVFVKESIKSLASAFAQG